MFLLLLTLFLVTKEVNYLVLINHSCISPTLQKRWELEFCLFSKKIWWRRGGGGGLWESSLWLLLVLAYVYLRNITSLIIYPNFWRWVLIKTQILEICVLPLGFASLFQEQKSVQYNLQALIQYNLLTRRLERWPNF